MSKRAFASFGDEQVRRYLQMVASIAYPEQADQVYAFALEGLYLDPQGRLLRRLDTVAGAIDARRTELLYNFRRAVRADHKGLRSELQVMAVKLRSQGHLGSNGRIGGRLLEDVEQVFRKFSLRARLAGAALEMPLREGMNHYLRGISQIAPLLMIVLLGGLLLSRSEGQASFLK